MGAQSEGATALPRRVQRAASYALLSRACVVVGAAEAISMECNEGTPTRAHHRGAAHFGLKECSGACTLAYAQQVATQ